MISFSFLFALLMLFPRVESYIHKIPIRYSAHVVANSPFRIAQKRQLILKSNRIEHEPTNIRESLSLKVKNSFSKIAFAAFLLLTTTSQATRSVAEEQPEDKKTESNDGYVTTASGLRYKDLKVGAGELATPGQVVRIHYTGWLDGFDSEKKFDSSYDRRAPLTFKVGTGQVISGWDEGILTDFRVGGQRELIVPASLGYGSRGAGGVIPPNATLYFRIEFVGFNNKNK